MPYARELGYSASVRALACVCVRVCFGASARLRTLVAFSACARALTNTLHFTLVFFASSQVEATTLRRRQSAPSVVTRTWPALGRNILSRKLVHCSALL